MLALEQDPYGRAVYRNMLALGAGCPSPNGLGEVSCGLNVCGLPLKSGS